MNITNYHQILRKIVTAFAGMFNDIILVRYNPDGTENQRLVVPIVYGNRESYTKRINSDQGLDKKIQITLPRMAWELNAITYDQSRKLNTNIKNYGNSSTGVLSQYNPVPYDLNFSVYVYVRNIEDGNQILENILPYFTPDYTLKLNLIPELNDIREIPIVLNSTSLAISDEFDNDGEVRTVIYTLNFSAKAMIYGSVTQPKLIKTAIENIYQYTNIGSGSINLILVPNGFANYKLGEVVYQGMSSMHFTAKGIVSDWDSSLNRLVINNIDGEFQVGQMIKGQTSLAYHQIKSFDIAPLKVFKSQFDVTPNTALANSNYTITTTYQEFPNIT